MTEVFDSLGINGPFLLAQIVNILILFGALSVLLWKPLTRRLDERREMLRKQEEDAEAIAQTREEIEEERQRALEEARAEADQILVEARGEAREIVEEAKADARQEAEKILSRTRREAEEERNRLLGDMREDIASLAIAAAHQLVGEALDEQRQRKLVESFFSGVSAGKVQMLPEGMERLEHNVVVTSAVPLTHGERANVRQALKPHMKEDIDIAFDVDPEILGGLVIRAGDRVIDGSMAGQLDQLRRSLV